MRVVQKVSIGFFALGIGFFIASLFLGSFKVTQGTLFSYLQANEIKSNTISQRFMTDIVGKEFNNSFEASKAITICFNEENNKHRENQEWDLVVHKKDTDVAFSILKPSGSGLVYDNKLLWFFLTFGLCIISSLIFILINYKILGPPGIKNNGVYHSSSTARGLIAWVVMLFLILFYLGLYFRPNLITNWTYIVDPVKSLFINEGASQWFLYGFLYCVAMIIMGLRMVIKYRHNKYQIVRTISVVFFQVVFAFLLVELLPLFNMPGVDLKNAWPLDYDFLFDWNVKSLIGNGNFGKFVFVWGIVFSIIIIPIMVYLYGKRWYCSWVCGCGGLAETLGDPYRQHSSKTLFSWKLERWVIHAVLVFVVIMTGWVGYHTYQEIYNPGLPYEEKTTLLGISSDSLRAWYGFLIGSWFSGVIGTGFYPIFGNRVWCRFGCPLAAYMGLVQRFKSRFRITTNGGQCISCGNCSTYCEQGIDVRAYAQKGQNIVRSSCVGCGICSAVCPRGVLKLENGPNTDSSRFSDGPIVLGNDGLIHLNDSVYEISKNDD